ncbi:hypothetical protein, partial [Plasmodium yoelii yoelii]
MSDNQFNLRKKN